MGCQRRQLWHMSNAVWCMLSRLQTSRRWLPSGVGSVFTLLPYSLHCKMAQLSTGESTLSDVSTRMEVQRMTVLTFCALTTSVLFVVYSRTSVTLCTQFQRQLLCTRICLSWGNWCKFMMHYGNTQWPASTDVVHCQIWVVLLDFAKLCQSVYEHNVSVTFSYQPDHCTLSHVIMFIVNILSNLHSRLSSCALYCLLTWQFLLDHH